jgi:hypothetical protein
MKRTIRTLTIEFRDRSIRIVKSDENRWELSAHYVTVSSLNGKVMNWYPLNFITCAREES